MGLLILLVIERHIKQTFCFHSFGEVSFQNILLASEELHFPHRKFKDFDQAFLLNTQYAYGHTCQI